MDEHFDTELVKKLTVGIGDAAKITNVPIRKIRYWEEKGFITSAVDGENVNRKYDYFAIKKIMLINELVEEGYMLDKAAEKVAARIENMSVALEGLRALGEENEEKKEAEE